MLAIEKGVNAVILKKKPHDYSTSLFFFQRHAPLFLILAGEQVIHDGFTRDNDNG